MRPGQRALGKIQEKYHEDIHPSVGSRLGAQLWCDITRQRRDVDDSHHDSDDPSPKEGGQAAAPRSEKSIECSKEADAQKLHGKKRKTFRKECMKKAT